MSQFEYLVTFTSIIAGLGVVDLAQSFRELVRPRRPVRWHWLPLLWAVITFYFVVQIWWNGYQLLQESTANYFVMYLLTYLLLYLVCAFALPDPEWSQAQEEARSRDESNPRNEVLDLEAFYFSGSHRRWYFGVFSGCVFIGEMGFQINEVLNGSGPRLESAAWSGGVAALLALLIATDRWWVHVVGSGALFLLSMWSVLGPLLA